MINSNNDEVHSFQVVDKDNGSVTCYADYSTRNSTDVSSSALSKKLSKNYSSISEFMVNNRLKLNDDKTHLIIIGASKEQSDKVKLFTPSSQLVQVHLVNFLAAW